HDELLRGRARAALLGHELPECHPELLALETAPALGQMLLDVLCLGRVQLAVEEELDLAEDVLAVNHQPTHALSPCPTTVSRALSFPGAGGSSRSRWERRRSLRSPCRRTPPRPPATRPCGKPRAASRGRPGRPRPGWPRARSTPRRPPRRV